MTYDAMERAAYKNGEGDMFELHLSDKQRARWQKTRDRQEARRLARLHKRMNKTIEPVIEEQRVWTFLSVTSPLMSNLQAAE